MLTIRHRGEPRESREIGVNTPLDGLYLREDININCSVGLTAGFVKKEFKQASNALFDRIIRKAELLDEGRLHAMFEDGKLKTAKPSGAPTFEDRPLPSPGSAPGSPPPLGSPRFSMISENTPPLDQKGFGRYHDVARNSSVRSSAYIPGYQQPGYNGPQDQYSARPGSNQYGQSGGQQNFVSELPGSFYQPQNNGLVPEPLKSGNQMSFRAELPGEGTLQPPPVQYDRKPTPPTATHPAYQMNRNSQGAGSPQPSPGLSQFSQDSNRLSASQPSNSPNLAQRSSYQVTNPDAPPAQPGASSSASNSPALGQANRQSSHSSVQEWRQSVQNDTPIDANYYRNGRPPDSDTQQLPSQQQQGQQQGQRHLSTENDTYYRNSSQSRGSNVIQPDHQRFSNLSIQENANEDGQQQQNHQEGGTSKCPVCGLFEGDATAVSHHVTKAHFQ